jgi:2-C-methyl-D-erythritol 4-phosphate cytidylyltransferase
MTISRDVPPPTPQRARGSAPPPAGTVRDVGVVIVAAGRSSRTSGDELKQFRWIAGKPMLLHSVETFLARADVCAVVCVLPDRYAADPPPWLLQADLDRLLLSVGGDERSDSVRNGLEDLAGDARIVLVHDAARPFVPQETIDLVIATVREGVGAVPALPVVDTIKVADAAMRIVQTTDRRGLWRAQTPQGFPRDVLERAYREARGAFVNATDDAALVERLGVPVQLVRGSELAMKVTEEEDFARAEQLIGRPSR